MRESRRMADPTVLGQLRDDGRPIGQSRLLLTTTMRGGSTSGGGGLNFIIVKPCNSLHIYYILYTIYIYTIYYIHIYYEGSTGGGDGPNVIIVKPCNSLLTMAFQSSISGTHRHYMQCFMVQTIFYTIVQCASFGNYNTNNLEEWFSFFVLANCNYAVG